MTSSVFIPLNQLRFGHEASPPINSRRTGRDAEVEALAASMKAHGLIHPLKVQEGDIDAHVTPTFYVADGNRRLAALLHLRDALGVDVDADLPVRCEVIPAGVNALETSQAANITHLPPHEADQFETFSLLAKTFQPAEIAGRFGIEVKRVHRMLALGELSPIILDAWRANTIDGAAVRAFTLAPSVEEQERVYEEQRKIGWQGQVNANNVRRAFGAGQDGVGHLVAYVGEEAYVAAGGSIRTDLFGTNHVVSDPALAKRMAEEKLQLHCETLTAKHGWGWAASADTLPEGARYNWRRESGKIKKADRINYGCILSVTREGTVSVEEGYVRPEDRKKAEKAAALAELERQRAAYEVELAAAIERGEEPPPPPAQPEAEKKTAIVSNMLAERLSQQFTVAMQACIRQDAHLALAAITAGLQAGGHYGQPARLRCEGYQPERPETAAFEDAFDALSHMDMEQLLAAFCHAAAPAIDLQVSSNAKRVVDNMHNLALVDGTGEDLLMPALRAAFDAEDYFKNAPKALVLQAIAEGVNPDEARKVAGKPAADIKAFALANIDTKAAFGWLPPELRTSHYDGPSLPGAWDAKPAKEDTAALAEGITELKPKRSRKAKAETVGAVEGEEAEVAA